MKVSEENRNKIAEWQRLKSYRGFRLLFEELEKIKKEAEAVIFSVGSDSKPEYSRRDLMILHRDNAMRIMELPDRMIAQLSGTGTQPMDNPDAFSDQNETSELDDVFEEDLNS